MQDDNQEDHYQILIKAVRSMLSRSKGCEHGNLIQTNDFEKLSLLVRQQSADFIKKYNISEKDLDELSKIKPPIQSESR